MQGSQPARSYFETASQPEANPQYGSPVLLPSFSIEAATAEGHYLQALPEYSPRRQGRKVPLIVRCNRLLRTLLVTFCGLALLGYGLDVASSSEVGKLQEQARRLSEQNTELSAQLLRAISFQGIQASVVGRAGLRVPEHVVISKEVTPPAVKPFKPSKFYLPLMSGY